MCRQLLSTALIVAAGITCFQPSASADDPEDGYFFTCEGYCPCPDGFAQGTFAEGFNAPLSARLDKFPAKLMKAARTIPNGRRVAQFCLRLKPLDTLQARGKKLLAFLDAPEPKKDEAILLALATSFVTNQMATTEIMQQLTSELYACSKNSGGVTGIPLPMPPSPEQMQQLRELEEMNDKLDRMERDRKLR